MHNAVKSVFAIFLGFLVIWLIAAAYYDNCEANPANECLDLSKSQHADHIKIVALAAVIGAPVLTGLYLVVLYLRGTDVKRINN